MNNIIHLRGDIENINKFLEYWSKLYNYVEFVDTNPDKFMDLIYNKKYKKSFKIATEETRLDKNLLLKESIIYSLVIHHYYWDYEQDIYGLNHFNCGRLEREINDDSAAFIYENVYEFDMYDEVNDQIKYIEKEYDNYVNGWDYNNPEEPFYSGGNRLSFEAYILNEFESPYCFEFFDEIGFLRLFNRYDNNIFYCDFV